jgi:hypothetical protein
MRYFVSSKTKRIAARDAAEKAHAFNRAPLAYFDVGCATIYQQIYSTKQMRRFLLDDLLLFAFNEKY